MGGKGVGGRDRPSWDVPSDSGKRWLLLDTGSTSAVAPGSQEAATGTGEGAAPHWHTAQEWHPHMHRAKGFLRWGTPFPLSTSCFLTV